MGCFSWRTADTDESIGVALSGHPNAGRTVYLLQPGGEAPIQEYSYDGYGSFGGVDAHEWLAKHNLSQKVWRGMDEDSTRCLGISLESESVLVDPQTGAIWSIYDDHRDIVGGFYFDGRWNEIMPGYDQSPNALMESGRLVSTPICDLFEIKFPLKFSFSREARYEDLPASRVCADQGFFFKPASCLPGLPIGPMASC